MLKYLFYTIVTIAIVRSQKPHKEVCDSCINVDNVCYNVSHLFELQADFRTKIVIHEMHILRSDNILYFSYEPEIPEPNYYKVGFVNLSNPEKHGVITSLHETLNFGSIFIQQENSTIYLGGSNGIYELDPGKTLKFKMLANETIIDIFMKNDNIFFVRDQEYQIIQKTSNKPYNIYLDSEKVVKFTINGNNNIIAITTSGLYLYKYGGDKILLSKNPFFRGITQDLDGTVYVWWIDGIYKVLIEPEFFDSRLVKVANIEDMGAMTFDNNNNIIFNSDRSLVLLTKTAVKDC